MFKEYLYQIKFEIVEFHTGNDYCNMELTEQMFNMFESFFEERHKEEKVKKILDKYILKIEIDDKKINGNDVNRCYNELKKEGCLK